MFKIVESDCVDELKLDLYIKIKAMFQAIALFLAICSDFFSVFNVFWANIAAYRFKVSREKLYI